MRAAATWTIEKLAMSFFVSITETIARLAKTNEVQLRRRIESRFWISRKRN